MPAGSCAIDPTVTGGTVGSGAGSAVAVGSWVDVGLGGIVVCVGAVVAVGTEVAEAAGSGVDVDTGGAVQAATRATTIESVAER